MRAFIYYIKFYFTKLLLADHVEYKKTLISSIHTLTIRVGFLRIVVFTILPIALTLYYYICMLDHGLLNRNPWLDLLNVVIG